MIFFLFLGIVGGVALLWPARSWERANALVTPPGIKPDWYYLSLFQLLKVVPERVGLIVPFVTNRAARRAALRRSQRGAHPLRKPFTTSVATALVGVVIAFTIWAWWPNEGQGRER